MAGTFHFVVQATEVLKSGRCPTTVHGQRQLNLAAILGCWAACHAMCVQADLTANHQLSKQHRMGGPVLSQVLLLV